MLSSVVSARLAMLAALALPMTLAPMRIDAAETRTFKAQDGSYSFEYPLGFSLDHLFADGTGDVAGVKASSPANGDVRITFLGPRDAGELQEVSERTRQSIADAFTKAIAVRPSITLKSATMTTLLGRPAVDMVFSNGRPPFSKERPQIKRYVFTAIGEKAYNFECIYRADKAEQFAPACDLAVSTVRLLDPAADAGAPASTGDNKAATRLSSGCTKLELNRRAGLVMEATSDMLMKDQSPATIERLGKAHAAMRAIDERAGDKPSERDCKDIDAIGASLK
ncbi:hypothetical protein [Bosea sp. NPDC055594]